MDDACLLLRQHRLLIPPRFKFQYECAFREESLGRICFTNFQRPVSRDITQCANSRNSGH